MNHLKIQMTIIVNLFYYGISFEEELFTVKTEGCVIRALHPFDDSIKHLMDTPHIDCDPLEVPLLDNNDTHIWVLKENVNAFDKSKLTCCYKHFQDERSLDMIDCINFSSIIAVKDNHEFVYVECFYLDNSVYSNFYSFIPIKPQKYSSHNSKFNVLVLGLESVSRMNFYRTMPKTLRFLKDKGAIDLKGYNKLGDNSIPNLIPLLVGESAAKVENKCIDDGVWNHNKCSFIWNKYEREGYLTALGADSAAGVFEPYFAFKNNPTQYYLHPFISQSTKIIGHNKRVNYYMCMGHNYYNNVLLDYIFRLKSKLNRKNMFGFFWEESVSHDGLNYPKIMDDNYLTFFKKLEDFNYLNDTIVILLSDHGFRWGEIVRTYQGHMEERLPLAFILLPKSFLANNGQAYKNLKNNSHKLMTAFDIYATLDDILNIKNGRLNKKLTNRKKISEGISLFHQIPRNRTCASVGIQQHWCTCYKGREMSVDNQTAKEAGRQIVAHINKLLKAFQQCEKLLIEKVIRASMIEVKNKEISYNIVVKVTPGGAVFEGTLLKKGAQWAMSGTVSRLDQYGNKKHCINDYYRKMYCYCK